MTTSVGVLNLVLGLVYCQYGTMTLLDLRRNWSRMGFSHFGAAWIAMAFTCGPHHVAHGSHILFEGFAAGPLDLLAVIVGLPAGVIWFLLRLEAFAGRAGDRHVAGTPVWLMLLPTLGGIYFGSLAVLSVGVLRDAPSLSGDAIAFVPNAVLILVYAGVAGYLIRTQLANREALRGWSVSGLALSVVFPTCAVMHGIHAVYTLAGRYEGDAHLQVIDWLAIPAGLYFLFVVRALYRGSFRDWNETHALAPASAPAPT